MKVGIIGLGSIGQRHAVNSKTLGLEVLVFDPDEEKCKQAEYGIGVTACNLDEISSGVDFVIVSSPSQFHLQNVQFFLDHRLPVLCEKPLGHDLIAAKKMVSIAEEHKIPLAVSHNLRFRKSVKIAKSIISSGTLGRCIYGRFVCGSYLPDWRPKSDYRENYAADKIAGGVIFDAIHEIDLAIHLLGSATYDCSSVKCTKLLDIPTEDLAEIMISHSEGVTSNIHLDYISRPRRRDFFIQGDMGCLSANIRSGLIKVHNLHGDVLLDEDVGFNANDEYLSVIEDFCRAVWTGSPVTCDAREALLSLEIACSARASFYEKSI